MWYFALRNVDNYTNALCKPVVVEDLTLNFLIAVVLEKIAETAGWELSCSDWTISRIAFLVCRCPGAFKSESEGVETLWAPLMIYNLLFGLMDEGESRMVQLEMA